MKISLPQFILFLSSLYFYYFFHNLQTMSDHFDHYTRPPSRDSSVDRYTRAASRMSGNSRQPSVDRNKPPSDQFPLEQNRGSPIFRSTTPISNTSNGSVVGAGINVSSNRISTDNNQPFEDFILRKRSIGQDIVPSPVSQPKRTESLYISTNTKKESQNKVSILLRRNNQFIIILFNVGNFYISFLSSSPHCR